jgi:ketosteroid isomerase-like protein
VSRRHPIEEEKGMSESTLATVEELHDLNGDYIRAFVESDVAWYRENVSEDFVCTLGDGSRIGKAEFLQRCERGPGVGDMSFDEIDVRPFGDMAVVHGVTNYTKPDGVRGSTRYTDVWLLRDGRWQAIAAHLTRVGGPAR